MYDNLLAWGSRRQNTIALSSAEAEYYAMTDGIKELLHIQNTMSEFLPVSLPIPLEVDNKGAGYMAENDINNKRTKHIDIRYHFIREFIKNGTIELFYIESAKNIADVFTKALPVGTFIGFTRQLFGLVEARA